MQLQHDESQKACDALAAPDHDDQETEMLMQCMTNDDDEHRLLLA